MDVHGSPMFRLFHKLKHCRHALVDWQQACSTNSRRRIEELQKELLNLKENGTNGDSGRIIGLEKNLLEAHQQEERYWKEKS